jgi:hypothetical protein
MKGVYSVNNHPAPEKLDGGKGMYDIMVHEHVLMRIADKIKRYPHLLNEAHRTSVDHHEVFPREKDEEGMDIGISLSSVWVDIPPFIITNFMSGDFSLRVAAEHLQKHVMKYEYQAILGNAAMDVQRVIDAKKYGIKLGGFN